MIFFRYQDVVSLRGGEEPLRKKWRNPPVTEMSSNHRNAVVVFRGASSLRKKLTLLRTYSVARSFYCSKYKKYTSKPKLKLKFSKSDTITGKFTITENSLCLLVCCNELCIYFKNNKIVWQRCTWLSKLSFFARLDASQALV